MEKQNIIYPVLLLAVTNIIFNLCTYGQVTVTVNPSVVIDTVVTKGGSNHTGLTSFTYAASPTMVNDLTSIPYKLNRIHFSGEMSLGVNNISHLPQTSPTTWNFIYMDSLVNAVNQVRSAGNHDFILAVSLCPTWMTAGGIDSGGAPTNYYVFAQYAARLVRYYNQGSFFDGTNTITNPAGAVGIHYWEIWNEPDQNYVTGDATPVFTPTEYANLFQIVSDSMRAADPTILIGGPNTSWMHWYADTLLASAAQVDFVSIHHYPADTFNTDLQVFQIADTLPSVNLPSGMPLIIGEMNAIANWNDSRMSSLFELAYMPLAYKALILAGIDNVIRWETVEDIFPVLNINGSKHRTYWMEKYFWSVIDSGSQVISCNSSSPDEISCLAVKTSLGKVKLVLINKAVADTSDINGIGVSRTITISGLPAGSYETVVIDTLTNPATGPIVNSNTPSSIIINGYGIAVIAQGGFTLVENVNLPDNTDITMYPNPFDKVAIFKINSSWNYSDLKLNIYSPLGVKVENTVSIKGNETKIERNNLRSGMYFYQITHNRIIIGHGKFIIK